MKRSKAAEKSSKKVVSYQTIVDHRAKREADGEEAKSNSGIILVVLGILILLMVSILILPVFRVNDIVVSGAEHVDAALIIESSQLDQGDHLFEDWGGSLVAWLGLRYGGAEERIHKASSYVQNVRVRMAFPGKIRISIEERIPTSYLALEDQAFILLDAKGYVLEFVDGEAPIGIPMIEGILVNAAEIGSLIQTDSIASIDTALNLIDSMIRSDRAASDDFSLLSCIKEIRAPGNDSSYLKIKLLESEIPIHAKLGEEESFDDALNWLRYTIYTKKLDDLGSGVLDLSGDNYVFIRDVEEGR